MPTLDSHSCTLLQFFLPWRTFLSPSQRHYAANVLISNLLGEQPVLWNYLPLADTIPDDEDDAPIFIMMSPVVYMTLASTLSSSSTCPQRTNLVLRLLVFPSYDATYVASCKITGLASMTALHTSSILSRLPLDTARLKILCSTLACHTWHRTVPTCPYDTSDRHHNGATTTGDVVSICLDPPTFASRPDCGASVITIFHLILRLVSEYLVTQIAEPNNSNAFHGTPHVRPQMNPRSPGIQRLRALFMASFLLWTVLHWDSE